MRETEHPIDTLVSKETGREFQVYAKDDCFRVSHEGVAPAELGPEWEGLLGTGASTPIASRGEKG